MVTAFTALAALVFTALSLAATRDQIDVTEQGQITDRYTTAVNQMSTSGADHLETRLGGIYALERLAIDSPRDQPTIVEVLSAFVRSNTPAAIVGTTYSPNSACAVPRLLPMDVQAALTVLGRRNPAHDANAVVDLTGACLVGADLTGDNLEHANLKDANLAGDNLTGANLAGGNLTDADLTGTYLKDATLTDVYLMDADLTGAYLAGANLTGTDLSYTSRSFADLTGVVGLVDH
jgi:hypothetical protein